LDNAGGTGELHVFIELDDQARDQTIRALIEPLLEDTRTPFHVHPVRRLPRTGTGKVRRAELKQSLTPPA
jgi:acyl-coenzyme A synthetase/AMP-(fatty) acid ligase